MPASHKRPPTPFLPLHLQWKDIDLEKKQITVSPKTAAPFQLPDGEVVHTFEWTPKSYAARNVPIPDRTAAALKQLKSESDRSPYLFLTLERLRHLNRKDASGVLRSRFEPCNNVLRDFGAIQRKAATAIQSKDWTIGTVHDLRRSFGTHAANKVPMHVLRVLMGHADISTTATFYLAVGEEHAASVRKVFDSH